MYNTSLSYPELESIINGSFGSYYSLNKSEIKTTETGHQIQLSLPGFLKEEVQVRIEDKEIVIEAKTSRDLPKFIHKNVKKVFLTDDIDVDDVKATLTEGILTITFSSKKKASAKTVSIL